MFFLGLCCTTPLKRDLIKILSAALIQHILTHFSVQIIIWTFMLTKFLITHRTEVFSPSALSHDSFLLLLE